MTKCNNKCMCGRNIHDKNETKQKHSVLWHTYHTILAVELGIIVIIEALELFDWGGII